MNVLSSVTRTIGTIFDTATQSVIALNHLARGAAERTVVIEDKSVAAAAMSQLQNHHDVARRLQDLYKNNTDLSPDAIEEGKAFLDSYKAERKLRETPVVVTLFRDTRRKKEVNDSPSEPHVPGVTQ